MIDYGGALTKPAVRPLWSLIPDLPYFCRRRWESRSGWRLTDVISRASWRKLVSRYNGTVWCMHDAPHMFCTVRRALLINRHMNAYLRAALVIVQFDAATSRRGIDARSGKRRAPGGTYAASLLFSKLRGNKGKVPQLTR
jgi:hypothetical protein